MSPDAPPGGCAACWLAVGLESGPDAAPLDASYGDVTLALPAWSGMPAQPKCGVRYQLLGEIARGGMGAVLRGRDPELGRDLAVKVLLEEHRGRPELVRRFVEEARIGGQLQHPGVVPVYELGSFADRRPYFTMKLVGGRTLAELLGRRAGPAEDRARLLPVFEQVCQTVAYAHSRGVIHRDLKPSNVMVGDFGEVQVMDWGLAKVLGDSNNDEAAIWTVRSDPVGDASQDGSVLGTPAYMAPEQARGDVSRSDRRADVFGLGSILCEVLTGRPAFVGTTRDEVTGRAMRGETAGALARLEACGADAELVALARDCLAVEPDDRPADAGVVAARVSAHRAGVQERLRAAELARAQADARAQEERKRRKLAWALAAAVVGLMAVGGTGAAVYWQQARDAATKLSLAMREAHRMRDQAAADPSGDPARWRAAGDAVQRAAELLGPLAGVGARRELEALRAEVEASTASAERDAALLREAVDIRSAEADDPDGSLSDAAYAEAFRAVGLDVDGLGPDETAARIRSRPADVASAFVAALDDWAGRRRVVRPRDELGWARLVEAARAADPDPTRGRMRAIWARADPEARRADLRALAGEADARDWSPASLLLLARALRSDGEHDTAVALLRRAQAHHPGDVWLNHDLARALEGLHPRRTEEAIGYYTAARALRPEIGHSLAHALEARGRGEEAAAVFADLVRLRPGIGGHWGCYGQLLIDQGDRDGAAAALDRAVTALREETRRRPGSAGIRNGLGNALRLQGRLDQAMAAYRDAIRLEPGVSTPHRNLGIALMGRGEPAEAIAEFREALRLAPDDAKVHCSLGNALRRLGKLDEAIAAYRDAIRLEPDLAQAHTRLGAALAIRGNLSTAIAEFREAIRLKPDLAESHFTLGNALQGQGKLDEAIATYCEAIRLKPGDAESHCNLGNALRRQGRFQESLAEFRRGHDLGSKRPDWPYPSADWVREAERMVALEDRLPALLRGDEKPRDAGEGLAVATMAYHSGRYSAAARLCAEILRTAPDLPENAKRNARHTAACAAAMAGAGRGEDRALAEAERSRWRKQAIAWLEPNLAVRSRQADGSQPAARAAAAQSLRMWRWKDELAGIRDPEAMAGLPEEEQREYRRFWSEVDAAIAKAEGRHP